MISIIIPFYNTEKYLKQCLDSIKNQTFSDYECLMIDDGSTDSSRIIAEQFAKEDSRFKLLNKEHIGFPQAKNLGLDNAHGDYICFVDSDDYVDEFYLEYLQKGLLESNTDICCCASRSFNENNLPKLEPKKTWKVQIHYEDKMEVMFTPKGTTFMWNKIFKKEIFDGLRFEDVEALSDTLLCPYLFEKARSVSTINDYLIYRRWHSENISNRVRYHSNTYWEFRLNVYIKICSYLLEKYSKHSSTYLKLFQDELTHIKPHLSEELYNEYLNKEEVKKILRS